MARGIPLLLKGSVHRLCQRAVSGLRLEAGDAVAISGEELLSIVALDYAAITVDSAYHPT
jgi:hypothetical protein